MKEEKGRRPRLKHSAETSQGKGALNKVQNRNQAKGRQQRALSGHRDGEVVLQQLMQAGR